MEANLIQYLRVICAKSPKERTKNEVSPIVELTKHVKVFKDLIENRGESTHFTCCKYLKYEYCPQGEFLFKVGDKGTRFYVIIQGVVGVQVPLKNANGETQMTEVVESSDGQSFGELALENDQPRSASIYCKTPSHFFALEKKDYKRILATLVQQKRDEMVLFLKSLPVFSNQTKGTLMKLTYNFKEKVFNKNESVYKEGQKSEELFLIISGEFSFYKKISVPNGTRPSNKRLNPIKRIHTFQARVLRLGVNEMFGEDDIILNRPRQYTCVCHESGKALVLQKKDFFRIIRGEESLKKIKLRADSKTGRVLERLDFLTEIEEDKAHSITPRTKRKRLHQFEEFEEPQEFLRKTASKSPMFYKRIPKREVKNSEETPTRTPSPLLKRRYSIKVRPKSQISQGAQTERRLASTSTTKLKTQLEEVSPVRLQPRQGYSVFSLNSFPIYSSLWKTQKLLK